MKKSRLSIFIILIIFNREILAVDKDLVFYINQSLAQIPNLAQFNAGQRCNNEIIVSNKSISFNYYEPLTVKTFNGSSVNIKKYVLDQPYPEFDSSDEAAMFFTDFIKKNFNTTKVEYCTVFEKHRDKIIFTRFYRGTPNSCPTNGEVFENPVASIHTHPGNNHDSPELSLPIQVPSYADYAVAVDRNHTQYMAGPAGQILKYTKEDIQCRGRNPNILMKLNFEEIRRPKTSSKNHYSIGQSFQLVEGNGKSYLKWLCPALSP